MVFQIHPHHLKHLKHCHEPIYEYGDLPNQERQFARDFDDYEDAGIIGDISNGQNIEAGGDLGDIANVQNVVLGQDGQSVKNVQNVQNIHGGFAGDIHNVQNVFYN